MVNTPYYYTTLRVDANVRVEQDEQGRYRATIVVGASELPLRSNQNMLEQIVQRGTQPSDTYRLVLSPRTNTNATLRAPTLRLLRHTDDLSSAEHDSLSVGFSALGQLVYISSEDASGRRDRNIGLRIYPNPGGSLRKPFTISVVLEPFLFNTLPPIGYGLNVTGRFDDTRNQIVVTRTETVLLPRRKPKPTDEPAAKATSASTPAPAPASKATQGEPIPPVASTSSQTRPQQDASAAPSLSDTGTPQQDAPPAADVSKPERRRVRVSRDKS